MSEVLTAGEKIWQEVKNTFLDVRLGKTGRAAVLIKVPDLLQEIGYYNLEEAIGIQDMTADILNEANIVPGPTGAGELFSINRAMDYLRDAFAIPPSQPNVHIACHLGMISLFRECGEFPGRYEDELSEAIKDELFRSK